MVQANSGSIVEQLMSEHQELLEILRSTGNVSLRISVDEVFSKTLAVAAASYYENRFTEVIVGLFESLEGGSAVLAEFVRHQAIGRRYAQLFSWDANNANGFFRSFGDGFWSHMIQKVNADENLEESIKAFLELGNLRNQLVHENFAAYPMAKTVDEVFDLFKKADIFVNGFTDEIREYLALNL